MEIVKGVLVQGVGELREQKMLEYDQQLNPEPQQEPVYSTPLAGFIMSAFRMNKDARKNSGVEEELIKSLRAYNGQYDPEDLRKIQATGGSEIFINITGVKCRAAASWIRDIQLPAKERAWSLSPTPVVDLPAEMKFKIQQAITTQFSDYIQPFKLPPPAPPRQQPTAQSLPQQEAVAQQQAPQERPAQQATEAAYTIKEFNQAQRDVEDMILAEIDKHAKYEMKRMETQIDDQLVEGKWENCLSDFVDDFTVYPAAFCKGPIISKDKSITYVDGSAQPADKYVYRNRRVSPFDMYPAPNATTIDDGDNLIEHMRFTKRELNSLRGLPGYKGQEIVKVLQEAGQGPQWMDTGLESEKAEGEKRGTQWEANQGVIHGIHFHGSIPVKELREWGVPEAQMMTVDDSFELEVDSILAGNHVIRCVINKDPLQRRPYYKASYQARPGSFWGISLPYRMRDIQRMCNATARALANNMGLASGPQIEIYTDRLADNGDITKIYPFKIWQLTSDPTGASGRAVNFTQPTSNAKELLAVYQEFEVRADDATGIPRYAYGNERVGGAAQTAHGLSMLLESASKTIKDCIRNIDQGVIVPRVEYQFYWNIATDPRSNYTGDPKVRARGSSSLTLKGSEQMRRNEFLQITSNPIDQQIMGLSGRAELLRSIAEDLNMDENVIPSRLELKVQQDEQAKIAQGQQQQVMQLEQQKMSIGLQATKEQITGQERMHAKTQEYKHAELAAKNQREYTQAQIAMARLEADREGRSQKEAFNLEKTQFEEQGKNKRFQTEVALKLERGEGV